MRIRRFRSENAMQTARCIAEGLDEISSRHYSKKIINHVKNNYSAKKLREGEGGIERFVAVEGVRIVGTIGLGKDGWILGFFVLPGFMGRGIGGRLLERIEDRAKKRGFGRIRAHVAVNSVGFYKKHGYKVVKPFTFEKYGKTYRIIKKLA
jgi:GNAT superfamily N-acetyltransferase